MAGKYWTRAAELTDPTQLLWAQIHMGLLGTAFIEDDERAAIKYWRNVLAVDPDKVTLPNWKHWPGGLPAAEKQIELERARVRKSAEEIQLLAVSKFGTLARMDRAGAIKGLQEVAAARAGTPVGKQAAELLLKLNPPTNVANPPATQPAEGVGPDTP